MKHKICLSLSLALGLTLHSIGFAQFDRVDAIVREVEAGFQKSFGVPASPGVEVADPSLVEHGIIRPLEWELKKLSIQIEILAQERSGLEALVQQSEHLLQDYSEELLKRGITSRSDINKKAELVAALEQQMRMLEAESQALKASVEKGQNSKLKKLRIEEAEVKLNSQQATLKAFKEQYNMTLQLMKQGALSSTEAIKLEAQLKQQEGELQLAQLQLEKTMAEADAAAVNELTKLTEAKFASQRQLEELKAELQKMSDGLKMLDEKDLQRSRLTYSDQQMSQLASSKSKLQMEYSYLKRVVNSYRVNLKKDASAKTTQSEDE
ncbi:MAG: hypothetical protein AAGG44_15775 [Planctomycetota bacterium]